MALIRPGAGVGQASGKLGSVVFSHNRGGAYVRARSVPVQPRGFYQVAQRAAMSAASGLWAGLGTAIQDQWSAWAQANPLPNRLGDMIRLAGNAAFCEVNARQFLESWPAVTSPPVGAAPGPLDTMVFSASIAGGHEIIWTGGALGASEHLYVRACYLTTLGQRFVTNKLRVVGQSPAAGASPWDYKAAVEARIGAMQVGKQLALSVHVYDHVLGLISVARFVVNPITA